MAVHGCETPPPAAAAQNDTPPPLFPQTVEAMQAILDDLTIDDSFSIIDFNHNVRCWSEDLVPGSSIQVKDAKKYIQNIRPNGGETPSRKVSLLRRLGTRKHAVFVASGTNINEALLRAVQMLVRASNQGLIDPRSVSMIILVSDGDPTVGKARCFLPCFEVPSSVLTRLSSLLRLKVRSSWAPSRKTSSGPCGRSSRSSRWV